MHLHSSQTPFLQHLWLDLHLKPDQRSVVEFLAETINMFTQLAAYTEELHCRCLATLSEEVHTTGITQGNLELLLPPNSPDSHQTQIQ